MGYTHYWVYKNPTIDLSKRMIQEAAVYSLPYDQRKKEFDKLPDTLKIVKRIENHINAFKSIAEDIQKIVDEATGRGIVIRNGLGVDQPIINPYKIWLNGDESQDLDHETFGIDLFDIGLPFHKIEDIKEIFGFCKIARKPYDLVVCASLISFKHHLKNDFKVSSDGSFENSGWLEAIDLYEKLFDRKIPKSFVVSQTKNSEA